MAEQVLTAGFVVDVEATAAKSDPQAEIAKAEAAEVCVQATPVPGHPLTITDPNSPILDQWSRNGSTCSLVVRICGKVVEVRTIHALNARQEMISAQGRVAAAKAAAGVKA